MPSKIVGGAGWISSGGGRQIMVALFVKFYPQGREMNDPVMIIQAKLFRSNYTNRVLSASIIKYHL